ncbi:hypothetical protein F5051DRAFT_444995 [Lentinula edodes]|nr:hypothetical protein F5051DRAFT_444995 [Lentinula edodes]
MDFTGPSNEDNPYGSIMQMLRPPDYGPSMTTPINFGCSYPMAFPNAPCQCEGGFVWQDWGNVELGLGNSGDGFDAVPNLTSLQINPSLSASIPDVVFHHEDAPFIAPSNGAGAGPNGEYPSNNFLNNETSFLAAASGAQRTSHHIGRFHPYLSTSYRSNYGTMPIPMPAVSMPSIPASGTPPTATALVASAAPAATPSGFTSTIPVPPNPSPESLYLSLSGQYIVPTSFGSDDPFSQEVQSNLPIVRLKKGPEVTTKALDFNHYCETNGYNRSSAMYHTKDRGRSRAATAQMYFQWANTRDFLKQIVGYTAGLKLNLYEIRYNDGNGPVENLTSILLHRLGWNVGTFEVTARIFEQAEHYAFNFQWNPNSPAVSTNGRTATGLVRFDKHNPYEAWKGIQYLFVAPGYFTNGITPLYCIQNSDEEQIASKISAKSFAHIILTLVQLVIANCLAIAFTLHSLAAFP